MTNSEADDLLNRWGAWSRHNISVGWPSINPIGRLIVDGGGAGHVAVPAGIPMPQEIQDVDVIMANLRSFLKYPAKLYYISRLSAMEGAKKCRCTEEDFNRRINAVIDIVVMANDEYNYSNAD